jgi:hypothetical protein
MSDLFLNPRQYGSKTQRPFGLYKIVSGTLKEKQTVLSRASKKNLKFSSPNAFLLKRKR